MLLSVLLICVLATGCGGKKKKKGSAGKAQRAAGAVCLVTEGGSLEQLLKAGERVFSRDPQTAEDCYRRAVEADKTSVLALYNLGLSQMNQGKHDPAIENFEQALVLHPQYGEAYFGMGSTLYDKAGPTAAEGQASSHKKLLNRAKSALKKAVQFSPNYFAAHNALGNVCLGLKDLKGAQQAYTKVVELNPRAPEGHANLARVLVSTGQAAEAVRAVQTAIGLAPDIAAFYLELASVSKAVGQDRLAKRCLRTAIRLHPRHAGSHYQLGELLAGSVFSDEKDIPGAMRHLTSAVRLDPSMAEAYMSLGMLYWGQGQMHRARDLLRAGG